MRKMDNTGYDFASDHINTGKVFYLTLFFIGILTLNFYTINIPQAHEQALGYTILAFIALFGWLLSYTINRKNKERDKFAFPDVIIYEKPLISIPRWFTIIMISAFLILGAYTFVSIGHRPTFAVISAPIYQMIELTPELDAILSIFSAWAEDFLFFLVIPSLVGGAVYFFTKNKWLAIVMALLMSPGVFALWHVNRYHPVERQVTFTNVYIFGFIMTGYVLVMRNFILPFIIHSANNAGIAYFSKNVVDLSLYFYIFTIFVILVTLWYLKRSSRKR